MKSCLGGEIPGRKCIGTTGCTSTAFRKEKLVETLIPSAADGVFAELAAGDADAGMDDVDTLESAFVDTSTFRRTRIRSRSM